MTEAKEWCFRGCIQNSGHEIHTASSVMSLQAANHATFSVLFACFFARLLLFPTIGQRDAFHVLSIILIRNSGRLWIEETPWDYSKSSIKKNQLGKNRQFVEPYIHASTSFPACTIQVMVILRLQLAYLMVWLTKPT